MDWNAIRSRNADDAPPGASSQTTCFVVGHDYELTPHPFDDPHATCRRCGTHLSGEDAERFGRPR